MIKWLGMVLLMGCCSLAQAFDHSRWTALLQQHVTTAASGYATTLDYRGMMRDRAQLNIYLDQLSAVTRQQFDQWSSAQQLAFLINAYNAWTVALVLTQYPELESIKALGGWFRSPWQKRFIPLLQQQLSLDDIEHDLIRGSGRYREPRIHFAVNCASIGCPALRAEAYRAEQLDQQLQQQTQQFLSDRQRNRMQDGRLMLSMIFNWYQQDFEQGWQGVDSLAEFIVQYREALALSEADVQRLRVGELEIVFLDYDWLLNDSR